jgi:hypothetical protein
MGDVHLVHELRLAGQVDVVGAGRGARRDHRLAEVQVRTDRRDHEPGPVGAVLERHVVGLIGGEQRQVPERAVDRREMVAHPFQLVRVAPGQCPAEAGRSVAGEVLRGQPAGEPGRAEQDQIQLAVRRRGGG